jgi:hypothetical protein
MYVLVYQDPGRAGFFVVLCNTTKKPATPELTEYDTRETTKEGEAFGKNGGLFHCHASSVPLLLHACPEGGINTVQCRDYSVQAFVFADRQATHQRYTHHKLNWTNKAVETVHPSCTDNGEKDIITP